MAAASSNDVAAGSNFTQLDIEAADHLFIIYRDDKLKALADRVSVAFLNANFFSMCACDFTSSVEVVIKNNRSFTLMNDKELLKSVGVLAEKKQKNFIMLIAIELNKHEKKETLKGLFNEVRSVATANNDSDMLEWLELLPGLAYAKANNEGVPDWLKPIVNCKIM